MDNFDDRIILDDEVEVKYEEAKANEERRTDIVTYSNRNLSRNNFFSLAFSKKFLALTFSSLSILMTLFMKFLMICGVSSLAFFGLWFFMCAGLTGAALVINVINYTKNKKVEFNVSTIITILSLIVLFLV